MADAAPIKSSTLKSDSEGYTRLHITPLDIDLLKVVVPAAVLPQARNISYHTIETFPEKRYGFVELPTVDAEKLRKKLNGATLRGTKVRIEQARPESIPQPTGDMTEEVKKPKKEKKSKDQHKKDKSKKRKYDSEVVEGIVIEDRKIKRGWTVTESDKIHEKRKEKSKSKDKDGKKEKKLKKRETKSKYTDAPECLFRQQLPNVPNELPTAKEDNEDEEDTPRRKKRKGDRQVLVHEFEKAHKFPTFLRTSNDTASSEPLTFEEGKGWVDAAGNVVEAAKSKRPTFSKTKSSKKKAPEPVLEDDDDTTSSSGSSSDSDSEDETMVVQTTTTKETRQVPPAQLDDDTTSSDDSSSEDEADEEEEEENKKPAPNSKPVSIATPSQKSAKPIPATRDDDDTSSSASSSEDEPDSDNEDGAVESKKLKLNTQPLASPVSPNKNDSARPKSSGSVTSLTIKIPPVTPAADKVHPLEALYKRPAGSEAAPDAGFSFFGNADDIDEEDGSLAPSGSQNPMTPYSKQDFEFRNIRSAAPTPDTAHPSRSQSAWPGFEVDAVEEEEAEEGVDDETGEDVAMADAADIKAAEKAEAKSEFQNWFWEHRGDLNRSWKKRRKTASKEKRNRENRARAARAI